MIGLPYGQLPPHILFLPTLIFFPTPLAFLTTNLTDGALDRSLAECRKSQLDYISERMSAARGIVDSTDLEDTRAIWDRLFRESLEKMVSRKPSGTRLGRSTLWPDWLLTSRF